MGAYVRGGVYVGVCARGSVGVVACVREYVGACACGWVSVCVGGGRGGGVRDRHSVYVSMCMYH